MTTDQSEIKFRIFKAQAVLDANTALRFANLERLAQQCYDNNEIDTLEEFMFNGIPLSMFLYPPTKH